MALLLLVVPLGGPGAPELTPHAVGQMLELGVQCHEVVAALAEAAHVDRDRGRVVVHGASGLEVVLDVAMVAVMTVRPARPEPLRRLERSQDSIDGFRHASASRSRGRRVAGEAGAQLRSIL